MPRLCIVIGHERASPRVLKGSQLLRTAGAERELTFANAVGKLHVRERNGRCALKSDRKGHFSIRINDQYRLCFRWTNEGPTDVEIVDYH